MRPQRYQPPTPPSHYLVIFAILASLVAACVAFVLVVPKKPSYSVIGPNIAVYRFVTPPRGGTITYGDWQAPHGANIIDALLDPSRATRALTAATWDGCILQLPDLSLREQGWRASLCTRVPTTANGDERKDGTATTIHIDVRARWSDGTAITADDFLFYFAALTDPAVGGARAPYDTASLTKIDAHTLRYDWHAVDQGGNAVPYPFYLASLTPPLYSASSQGAWLAAGGNCTVVSARERPPCYNAEQFQALLALPSFHQTPVVPGAYQVQSYIPGANPVITMTPNVHYFSNFLFHPALDQLIYRIAPSRKALLQGYEAGQYQTASDFSLEDIAAFTPIPSREIYVTPMLTTGALLLNQRATATNAAANGGTSIFADANVRRALFEALDRCTLILHVYGRDCYDPFIKTNELTTPLDPAYSSTYNSTSTMPPYTALAAGAWLDTAGMHRDKAGFRTYPGSTREITITLSAGENGIANAALLPYIQHDWQTNLNVHVTIVSDPKQKQGWAQGGTLARGTYDVALTIVQSAVDSDMLLGDFESDQVPSAAQPLARNVSGVHDAQFDSELATLRSTIDAPTRLQAEQQAYLRLTEGWNVYPLVSLANVSLATSTLFNYYPHPTSAGNAWNVADWGLDKPVATPTPTP